VRADALPVEGVVRLLADTGVLDLDDVISGRAAIRDVSRRNRNLAIVAGDGGLFVKRGGPGEGAATIANECHAYQRLADLGGVAREIAPHVVLADAAAGMIVLAGVPDAPDLREVHVRLGTFPTEPAAAAGRALAWLHRATAAAPRSMRAHPSILRVHRPDPEALGELTPASLDLIRVIQTEAGLCSAFDRLRRGWRAAVLMHGDVRWENILVPAHPTGRVVLIDWEHATEGEAAWDVGGMLAAYLSDWVSGTRVAIHPDQAVVQSGSSRPLGDMRAALGAFWDAYLEVVHLPRDEIEALRSRAVELAAARLVQRAFESTQWHGTVDGHHVLHVQVAANMLADPARSANDLAGWAMP
jgi:hypothetical protein